MTKEMEKTDGEYFADFLGWKVCEEDNCKGYPKHYITGPARWESVDVSKLDFKQWGALMPVIERILKMRDNDSDMVFFRTFGTFDLESQTFMVRYNRHPLFQAPTFLDALHDATLDFIKRLQNDKD